MKSVNHKIGIKVEMKSGFFRGSCYSDDMGRRDMWRELMISSPRNSAPRTKADTKSALEGQFRFPISTNRSPDMVLFHERRALRETPLTERNIHCG